MEKDSNSKASPNVSSSPVEATISKLNDFIEGLEGKSTSEKEIEEKLLKETSETSEKVIAEEDETTEIPLKRKSKSFSTSISIDPTLFTIPEEGTQSEDNYRQEPSTSSQSRLNDTYFGQPIDVEESGPREWEYAKYYKGEKEPDDNDDDDVDYHDIEDESPKIGCCSSDCYTPRRETPPSDGDCDCDSEDEPLIEISHKNKSSSLDQLLWGIEIEELIKNSEAAGEDTLTEMALLKKARPFPESPAEEYPSSD